MALIEFFPKRCGNLYFLKSCSCKNYGGDKNQICMALIKNKHTFKPVFKRSSLGQRKSDLLKRFNSYEIFQKRTKRMWPFNTDDCLIEVTTWVGMFDCTRNQICMVLIKNKHAFYTYNHIYFHSLVLSGNCFRSLYNLHNRSRDTLASCSRSNTSSYNGDNDLLLLAVYIHLNKKRQTL